MPINIIDTVRIDRDLLEEFAEYLSEHQCTGGRFPMKTHRAEADGVDHLLVGVREALKES